MYSTVDSGLTITSTGSGVRPDEGNADESVVSLLFNAAIRRSGFVKYSPVKYTNSSIVPPMRGPNLAAPRF